MNGSVPRKMSNHKALTGALATLLLWALGRGTDLVTAPPDAEVIGAWRALVEAVSSAIIGYVVVYMGPRNVIRLVPLCLAGAIVVGCETIEEGIDTAKDWSYDRGADARDSICNRSLALRVEGVRQINSRPGNGYWTATDCDKDGQPDFPIDPATGLPTAP